MRKAVSGDSESGVEFGLIIDVTSTTSAHVLILGLTSSDAGGGGGGGSTNKITLLFDTANTNAALGPVFVTTTDPDEKTGTFVHTRGAIRLVTQWFEKQTDNSYRMIDVDWYSINGDTIQVKLRGTLPNFEGYVEIIY